MPALLPQRRPAHLHRQAVVLGVVDQQDMVREYPLRDSRSFPLPPGKPRIDGRARTHGTPADGGAHVGLQGAQAMGRVGQLGQRLHAAHHP